ncbi:MAG: peptidase S8, partial [Aphanizomenon flos-aquae LD13]
TYGLSLNATAVAPVDNAGNTLATARNVGTLTATQSFSDWVGSADIDDYYSFNVTTPSNVNLNLTGLSADVDLYLLNSSGTVISSSIYGTTSESITSQLSAGTYYARVNRYSGNTTYGLSLNATAVAPVDNAGNTLATARNVGTLTAT